MYSITFHVNGDLHRPVVFSGNSVWYIAYRLYRWILRDSGASPVCSDCDGLTLYRTASYAYDDAIVLQYDGLHEEWTTRAGHSAEPHNCFDDAVCAFVEGVMVHVCSDA